MTTERMIEPRDESGQSPSDGADEWIQRQAHRIFEEHAPFGSPFGARGDHVGLAQFVEEVRAHDADQLGRSTEREDEDRDPNVPEQVDHLVHAPGAFTSSVENNPPEVVPMYLN